MFCPNCGTQNDSAATPCKKCGFKLSGISVPKFKGTMMLNSEQTVAEMIEEHRKKQAQGVASDKPKARTSEPAPRRNPGSSAPPSSLGGPRGPVLQPPRVAAPTRGRMGGTMLGVAPQVGGHAPPPGTAETPGTGSVPPSTPAPATAGPETSQSETPNTEAAVLSPPAASSHVPASFAGDVQAARPEPEPSASAVEPAAAAAPERTRPLPAVTSPDASAPGERAPDEPAPEPAALDAASAPAADPQEPAAPRAVAVTAPLPQTPEAPATPEQQTPAPLAASKPPSPPRLRPLDIVLIIFTFGIYGLVLWSRQRKPAA